MDKGKPFERLGRKTTGLRFLKLRCELPFILVGDLVTSSAKKKVPDLDEIWVVLIKEALSLGISTEEIRGFLKKDKVNN